MKPRQKASYLENKIDINEHIIAEMVLPVCVPFCLEVRWQRSRRKERRKVLVNPFLLSFFPSLNFVENTDLNRRVLLKDVVR